MKKPGSRKVSDGRGQDDNGEGAIVLAKFGSFVLEVESFAQGMYRRLTPRRKGSNRNRKYLGAVRFTYVSCIANPRRVLSRFDPLCSWKSR